MTSREKFIVLCDNDKLKKSDAIFLLEGDGEFRVNRAIELYRQKWAGLIVFSGGIEDPQNGSYPFRHILPLLLHDNIPMSSILLEEKSLNTREQGLEFAKLCVKHCWKRVILVGSHYHQYRAFLTFLKVLLMENLDQNIEIINAPANNLDWFAPTEWGARFDILNLEFEKIEKYYKLDHIAKFEEAIFYFRWKEQQI